MQFITTRYPIININLNDMVKKENDLFKKEIVDFHFNCLQGTYFSELINKDKYVLLFSDLVEDSYYNYVAQSKRNIVDILKESKEEFSKRNRKQAFYVTPCSDLSDSEDLIPNGFNLWATDAWMILKDHSFYEKYEIPNDITIEKVDYSSKDEYVKAFHLSYAGDNSDDPYANLPEYYSKSLLRSFDVKNDKYSTYYVWAKIKDEVVGVASMFSDGETVGIYGVGTIEKFRKKGIGTALMKHLYDVAIKEGISNFMLQTEYTSKVEKWYKSMGYETIFLGKYYVLD